MFFEASSIECRKTTCDVTKVIYNMYCYDTFYKIREVMEMNDQDSVKCRNSEKRGHDGNS